MPLKPEIHERIDRNKLIVSQFLKHNKCKHKPQNFKNTTYINKREQILCKLCT